MPVRPVTTIRRQGFLHWHWRILHPATGRLLLHGSTLTRRKAKRHATRAATRWQEHYAHLTTR